MYRRGFLTVVGTGTAIGIAGCTSDERRDDTGNAADGTDDTEGGDDEASDRRLGSEAAPRGILAVTLEAESLTAARDAVDAPVRLALRGEGVLTVFFDSTDVDPEAVEDALENAGFEIEAMVSSEWTGQPVCEVRSFVQFPRVDSEPDVESAFPDAIRISPAARLGGDEVWMVYSPIDSRDEIRDRLADLEADADAAEIFVYETCEYFDQ